MFVDVFFDRFIGTHACSQRVCIASHDLVAQTVTALLNLTGVVSSYLSQYYARGNYKNCTRVSHSAYSCLCVRTHGVFASQSCLMCSLKTGKAISRRHATRTFSQRNGSLLFICCLCLQKDFLDMCRVMNNGTPVFPGRLPTDKAFVTFDRYEHFHIIACQHIVRFST